MMHPQYFVAQRAHRVQIVGDQQQRASFGDELLDATDALTLEILVADREHLVDQQHTRVRVHRDRKPEAQLHPGGVGADGVIDEVAKLGEADDLRDATLGLRGRKASERTTKLDVLATAEGRVKPNAEVQKRGHPGAHRERPLGGVADPGEQPEQGALASAVAAHHAEGATGLHLKAHVAHRPVVGVMRTIAQKLKKARAIVRVDLVALA